MFTYEIDLAEQTVVVLRDGLAWEEFCFASLEIDGRPGMALARLAQRDSERWTACLIARDQLIDMGLISE